MPSRWQLTLDGAQPVSVPLTASHAVVSRWLDGDHKAAVKAYAVSPPEYAEGQTRLDVRLLDDSLSERLMAAATVGAKVRLGSQTTTIAQAPTCLAACEWSQLATSTGSRKWAVDFLTPTTFRRRNRTTPWPSPDSVMHGLLARWRAIHPDTAPIAPLPPENCIFVSDLAGRSEVLTLGPTVISGFVGSLHYACDGGENDAAAFDRLIRFADFAGVGAHTAYGLGVVRSGSAAEHRSSLKRRGW